MDNEEIIMSTGAHNNIIIHYYCTLHKMYSGAKSAECNNREIPFLDYIDEQ